MTHHDCNYLCNCRRDNNSRDAPPTRKMPFGAPYTPLRGSRKGSSFRPRALLGGARDSSCACKKSLSGCILNRRSRGNLPHSNSTCAVLYLGFDMSTGDDGASSPSKSSVHKEPSDSAPAQEHPRRLRSVVSFAADLIFITLVIAAGAAAYVNRYWGWHLDVSDPTIQALLAVTIIVLLLISVFRGFDFKARRFTTWGPNLFRAVANRLPIEGGHLQNRARVLVLYQSTDDELIARTTGLTSHDNPDLIFRSADGINPGELHKQLQKVDCVVILWSTAWRLAEPIVDMIANWASRNSEKPLVVYNLDRSQLPWALHWAWNMSFEAGSGNDFSPAALSTLLSRAVFRAASWRRQATRVWVFGVLVLTLLIGAGVRVRHAQQDERVRHAVQSPSIDHAYNAAVEIRRLLTLAGNARPADLHKNLEIIIGYVAAEVNRLAGINALPDGVTLWGLVLDSSGIAEHSCLCEVIAMPGKPPKCFLRSSRAVIACAVRNQWAVEWDGRRAVGSELRAVNVKGEAVAPGIVDRECSYVVDPEDRDAEFRKGLACFSRTQTLDESGGAAFCVSSFDEANNDALAESWLRIYLTHVGLAISTLPLSPLYREPRLVDLCNAAASKAATPH